MSNLSDTIGGADLFNGLNYSFVEDRFCDPNEAIYFNQGYLQVPPDVYLSGDFTVIAWIQLKFYQTNTIISLGNDTNVDNVVFFMSGSLLRTNIYNSTFDSFTSATTPGFINLNQWFHVATVLRNTSLTLYGNGVPLISNPSNVPQNVTRFNNFIGRNNYGNPSNAVYDDLKIFNRALSSYEILNDYKQSSRLIFNF